MKKNKVMRLASTLLVLTLLTTCVISGTFAKYTTKDSASDTARVAKWGVEVKASGGLFSKNYLTSTNTKAADDATTGISVQSSTASGADGANLVAPGTKNDTGLTFSITGTPEVAVKVDFAVTVNNDIFLKANGTNEKYKDYTTADDSASFALTDNYYPVKFTLKKGGEVVSFTRKVEKVENSGTAEEKITTEEQTVSLNGVNLATLEEGIESLNEDFIAPNTNLGTDKYGTYTLTWEWAYDDTTVGKNDQADTLLGALANKSDLQAKITTTSEDVDGTTKTTTSSSALTLKTDYNTNIGLQLDITVTQVD